jgi:hypothetical protein
VQLAQYSVISKLSINQVMMALILPVLFASAVARNAYRHKLGRSRRTLLFGPRRERL